MSGNESPCSLYIHIPFCKKKCPYCHFTSFPDSPEARKTYLKALFCELEQYSPLLEGRPITSIYFGGGTPFLIGPQAVSSLLEKVRAISPFDGEVTIEANPGSMDPTALCEYRVAGVNRLSLGVQSFNDHELATLCRPHSVLNNLEAVSQAVKGGFNNISLDLMYDLPNQRVEDFEMSLQTACSLPITHLSLYNLTIEPQTPWFRKKEAILQQMPTSDESEAMYRKAIDTVTCAGFAQYEISAFAKQGFHSIHNTGYWQGREFIGLGPSAFSFWGGVRFSNTTDLAAYIDATTNGRSPVVFQESLSAQERLREMVLVGLRMNEGIQLEILEGRYASHDAELRTKMDRLVDGQLLSWSNGRYALTDQGRMVYDSLAVELI